LIRGIWNSTVFLYNETYVSSSIFSTKTVIGNFLKYYFLHGLMSSIQPCINKRKEKFAQIFVTLSFFHLITLFKVSVLIWGIQKGCKIMTRIFSGLFIVKVKIKKKLKKKSFAKECIFSWCAKIYSLLLREIFLHN